MVEIFRGIFKSAGFTDAQLQGFANEFAMVALLVLITASRDKLAEENKKVLWGYWEAKQIKEIWLLLEGLYTTEEWKQVVLREVGPLLESYRKEVAGAG